MRTRTSYDATPHKKGTHQIVLLIIVLFVGCGETVEPITSPTTREPIKVNALPLVRTDSSVQTATYFGTLEANRKQTVGFNVAGKLSFVARRGEIVQTDQPLAKLDVNELEAQRATLSQTLERLKQSDQLPQSQNQVVETQRKIAQLDNQIEASTIAAPYDCIVDDSFAFEGSLVRPQSPIVRVIESKNPRIKIKLPRRIARLVVRGQELFFVVDENRIVAKLSEKSQIENLGNITAWFEIASDVSNLNLTVGQSVEANFDFTTDVAGFWLPLSALDRSGDGIWSVFAIEGNAGSEVATRVLVTIKRITDDAALVDGDLLPDSLVIKNGLHRVVPGQAVVPLTTAAADTEVEADVEGGAE